MCPPPHPLIPLTAPFLQSLAMTPEDGFFLQNPSSYQEPRPFLGAVTPAPPLVPLSEKWSRSVVSDSLRPHGHQAPQWDFLGKSTGVGCHFLLQGIFPTQGSNPGLLHCRQMVYRLSHLGPYSPVEIVMSYMFVRAPRLCSCNESACQFGRYRLDPWVRKIPWRRKWQPTPVFLPEKFYVQRSLVGYSLWDHKELGYN